MIACSYEQNPLLNRVLQLLVNRTNYFKDFISTDYINIYDKLHYQHYLNVSYNHFSQLCFDCLHHNFAHIDYLGIGNTYKLLYKNYY